MTTTAAATIVETVDREDGTRVHDAVLTVRQIVRLTCGCHRYECNRPGGGIVHVVRGQHCEEEQWRPLPGYADYEVNAFGHVRSFKKDAAAPLVLKAHPAGGQYLAVALHKNGKQRNVRIHVLVATAFLGPRPSGARIRHLDGDHLNNALSNLTYGTQSENRLDAVRHGTHAMSSKTHCPQGHPYDEANTVSNGKKPGRWCLICRRNNNRKNAAAYRARQAARPPARSSPPESIPA